MEKENVIVNEPIIKDLTSGEFNQILIINTTNFVRSVDDPMKVIRLLRDKEINIHFELENLDTIEVNNDFLLSFIFWVREREIKIKRKKQKDNKLKNGLI